MKILAIIKVDFKDKMDCTVLLLCKTFMHSHLEYRVQFWPPDPKQDKVPLQKEQRERKLKW